MAKQILFLLSLLPFLHFTAANSPKFPAAFFFGDSFLDTGNNDYIVTVTKAKHHPYGRDFPGGVATGRFSNGLLVPDLLSAELGIKNFSPPFLDPRLTSDDVLTGVNFASAGAGYVNRTSLLTGAIPFSRQVKMFKAYLDRLKGIAGNEEEATKRVGQSLIYVTSGSNDISQDLLSFVKNGTVVKDLYPDKILQNAIQHLQELYNLGGRRFIIAGIPPIGCFPLPITASLIHSTSRHCVDTLNANVKEYNSKLQTLLSALQDSQPNSKFIYFDFYGFMMDVLNNAEKYGFKETKKGCCGTGFFEVGPVCTGLLPICSNTSSFIFFDAVHPTESLYKLLTNHLMGKCDTEIILMEKLSILIKTNLLLMV